MEGAGTGSATPMETGDEPAANATAPPASSPAEEEPLKKKPARKKPKPQLWKFTRTGDQLMVRAQIKGGSQTGGGKFKSECEKLGWQPEAVNAPAD